MLRRSARSHDLAHGLEARGVIVQLHSLGAQRRGEPLEPLPDLEQLRHVAPRQPPDDRATLVAQLDKPFAVELEEGLADRAATDVELGHQVGLDQPLPGREPTVEDLETDDLGRMFRGLRVGRAVSALGALRTNRRHRDDLARAAH